MQLLLDNGADLYAKNSYGTTAQMVAKRLGMRELKRLQISIRFSNLIRKSISRFPRSFENSRFA